MKKRIVALVLVLLMCVSSLTACGGKEDPTEETGSGNGSATEVIFWHNRGGTAGETLEAIVKEYNEGPGAEAGIKITPVYQNDTVSTLKTVVQAKDTPNYPDMVVIFAGDVEYMSTVDAVVPAQDLIAQDDSFDAEILDSLLNTYTYAGTLYSVPFHASTMGFFWNKTAFEEAGLDPETPPKTIAEMAEMASKLLKKDSSGNITQYAITLGMGNSYINHWIGGQGQYSYIGNNENGRAGRMTKVTFDTDGTMAKLLTEWKKVLDTGAVQPVESGNQQRDEFCSGLSAMLCSSNSALGTVETMSKEMGFEYGVSTLPKVDASDSGSVCPGGTSVYVLNKGDDAKVKAAWEFVKYWLQPEQQYAYCTATGTIPVTKATMEYEPMKEYVASNPNFQVFYDALLNSDPHVQEHLAPTQQEFTTIFQEVCTKFSNGEISVDEAVNEMATRCNAALDEYNAANPVE